MVLGLADVTETGLVSAHTPGHLEDHKHPNPPHSHFQEKQLQGPGASALLALSSGKLNCCISAFNITLAMSSFCLKQQINTNYSGLPVSLSLWVSLPLPPSAHARCSSVFPCCVSV